MTSQRIDLSLPLTGAASLDNAVLHLHPADGVALARLPLAAGLSLDGGITVRHTIPVGHKVALRRHAVGEAVLRYGQVIGFATTAIEPGDHVHSHNLSLGHGPRERGTHRASGEAVQSVDPVPEGERRSFLGYRRLDGRVGTRNFLAIISSVNCSASVSRYIADRFRRHCAGDTDPLAGYPNVDGVIALTHKGGCGAHYGGAEVDLLQRTLAGFARHPNIAGYVLVGLGCEVNQIPDLVERQGLTAAGAGPQSLVIQEEGGLVETVEAGVRAVTELLPAADACRRETTSLSELVVALQCGGSDTWSGITANPALGRAVDRLVAQGGTAVLAETTEVYGAEHLLTHRAISPEVAEKLLARIRWWEQYTAMNGAEIDNNPTPGNKMGGLTTIYEKSLGAVAKSGSTPLMDVVEYAEPIRTHGFVHMDTPGFDPVSITGQVAGGCNLVVFTTGRGSVFGCRPAPTIKVATTTDLFDRMRNDMDIDAGRALQAATGNGGGYPAALDEIGQDIFELMIEVASGTRTRSERHGIGEEEFNPWILGATL